MIIREMKKTDLPALQKLFLDCRIKTFDWLPPTEFTLEDFEKSTAGEWVLVAEQENEIIGFASAAKDNFLHNLFVASTAQGNGVGKKLLAACFAGKLNKPVRLKCIVKNVDACKFYQANGWVIEQANVADDPDPYHLFLIT